MRGQLRLVIVVVTLLVGTFGCTSRSGGAPVTAGPMTPEAPSDGPEVPEKPAPPAFRLDHFLCYQGAGGEMEAEAVQLEDQFDRIVRQRDRGRVTVPFAFCNPVAKTPQQSPYEGYEPEKGRIQRSQDHLVAYRFETDTDRRWSAIFFNQITPGGGLLTFGKAQFLLVPSQKLRPKQHLFPRGLGHFKCYLVDDPPPSPGKFDLDDQFEGELKGVELTGARAICAPTDKIREGRKPERSADGTHLVCYGIERPAEAAVQYANQFQRPGGLTLTRIFGLCVPSRKEGVRRGGGPEG